MIEKTTNLMVASGAGWVLWLLVALSVASVAIAVERALAFRRARSDVHALVRALREALRGGDLARAQQVLEDAPGPASSVALAGLAEAALGPAAAQEAMSAAAMLERRRLERGLTFLGTVGNNAPFVGLLGTVIGIVGAFEELGRPQAIAGAMAAASTAAPEGVMSSIAEALVATAVGLVVAIPAVAAYNYFQAKVTAAITDGETLGHVLLSFLEGRSEGTRPGPELVPGNGKARDAGSRPVWVE